MTDFDLDVAGGRLRARRAAEDGRPLVIGVPGLTANLVSFEALAESHPMVVLDLRGRGLSEVTGPGTYGWDNHARDVLDAATKLGATRFAIVGWSMGAFVAMAAARQAAERIERLVLIDAAGPISQQVADLIRMSASRLGTVYPSLPEYLQLVRTTGLIEPWSDTWERYFAYELEPVEGGGVVARTSQAAVEEDMAYGETVTDMEPYWRALTMPTLLVRAARPLLPGSGADIVSPELLEHFRVAVPAARVVEIDANHYGVGTHPDTVRAVGEFLRG
jgi:pimeloyl-ACP methyl ester carboxylesterase